MNSDVERRPMLMLHFNVERRPPKATLPTPLFRSPSTRLIQRDIPDDGGEYCVDGFNLATSLEGPSNEVHHYSFKPTKQIVSIL